MVQSTISARNRGKNAYDEDEEETIYFDQTSKHMGSINKNMIFSPSQDSTLRVKGPTMNGFNKSTMVDYTLERNIKNQATYMVDIREQAQNHNNRFGKLQRQPSDDNQLNGRDDGGGASAASRGDIEKQPQDKRDHSDSSTDGGGYENKSHNSEADALYSENDENDLNASFDKGKGDTEGASS